MKKNITDYLKASEKRAIYSTTTTQPKEIDWEQRRYEIAKDVYCRNPGITEEEAIWNADALIKELKRIKVNEQ